ncbi:MAG: endonuclease/exonuclease/phosphatase family protein [Alistipes sp.]|nr:endonuclease/exonuclease/phosphatase family protein [Alistipes sp.]
MKKILFVFAFAVLSLSVAAQEFVVGSYNIRNSNSGDARNGNGWDLRCPVICDQVEWNDFDIFGAQEVKHNQLVDMLKGLPGYDYEGVGRDDGKQEGEYSPIFYKKSRFKKLDGGTFWISETPEKVGVKGWDAALPRICSYVRLQDKVTKKKIWFFNLHMDHIGVEARREGAKLVARKILEMCKGEAAIVTGDFNVDQTNEAYRTIINTGVLKDSFEKAEKRYATTGTFNSFDPNLFTESRIDHIFVTDHVIVHNYAVLTDSYFTPVKESDKKVKGAAAPQEIDFAPYQRRCPSDHYPIAAKITLKKK